MSRSDVEPPHAAGAEQAWIAEAVRVATDSVAAGGGPFGALIVAGDEVVATGTNRVTLDNDPTAHAEIVAIRAAGRARGDFRMHGCALASSCEPCPLCLGAALWSRLDRVVYAADRHDAARAGFDDRAFYETFTRPRESWPMPVVQLDTDGHDAPFAAWRAKPDRVEY